MFEAFRERMGRRALTAAVRVRTARPITPGLKDRSVLVVLPSAEEAQRAAWPFIESIDLPLSRIMCVVTADRVGYAPDRFAGSVQRIEASDTDWRGLPRGETVVRLQGGADVAINLAAPGNLVAQFIVATSTAAIRIGRSGPDVDPFYDLMLAGADSAGELAASLRRVLDQIEPPVLPLH